MFSFQLSGAFKVRLKVVLLEPEYEENIGLIARAMKNFGFSRLLLVNPKADWKSGVARSRAMHASDLLEKAKVFNSLEKALAEADFSAATTAVRTRPDKMSRNALAPKELAARFSGTGSTLALVFGRESTGLKNSEIKKCDFVVSIPSSEKYRTLNVSHSCAVLFHELYSARCSAEIDTANAKEKAALLDSFEKMADAGGNVRNRAAVLGSFRALVSRAPITKKEASAVTGVFAGAAQKIKK